MQVAREQFDISDYPDGAQSPDGGLLEGAEQGEATPTIGLPEGVAAGDDQLTVQSEFSEDARFGELDDPAGEAGITRVPIEAAIATEGIAETVATNEGRGDISADMRHPYGHWALALADYRARTVDEGDTLNEQWANMLLDEELASIREDFARWEAGLEEPESDAYAEAIGISDHFYELDEPHLPEELARKLGAMAVHEGDTTPGELKPEPDQPYDAMDSQLFGWFRSLTDEELMDYFKWSEERTNAVSEALAEYRPTIELHVRDYFDNLVAEGLAPESAKDALEKGFQHTAIFGALSAMESGFYDAVGLFAPDAKRIGVRREYDAGEAEKYVEKMGKTFLHEELHVLDAANDMGLACLESDTEELLTWVNEAVKEHLARSAMEGQPFVVDPAERKSPGSYSGLRELLHFALTSGNSEIGIAEVTAANFERRGTEGGYRAALVSRLQESYHGWLPDAPPGETILHVIAREYNAATIPLRGEVVRKWRDTLYDWKNATITDLADEVPGADSANLRIALGE